MKRKLCIGLLLVLIVGGYFAQTKLFHKEQVAEKQEQKENNVIPEEKKVPRMVKVNGTLYYDTGKLSTIEGRCGTADGYIHSTVLPNEIPKEDNESNFGRRYGYQYWDDNTIEVFLPTGWTVFSTNETEADMDTPKNYVTIQDGKIDNSKLIEQFIERVGQHYRADLTFLTTLESGDMQFYYLSYVTFGERTEPYSEEKYAYEYHLYVDTMKANEKPRYHFYQFQTLDTSNGMSLKDYGGYMMINFTDDVVQLDAEEFVIY